MEGQPERQETAFQQLSLQDLPALALTCIHEALWERDAEGFCASARDAASFRSTCKSFYDLAQLPSMLKLSFTDPIPDMSSLALLLSKPRAAGTLVSLRLVTSSNDFYKNDEDKLESIPITFSNLSSLGPRLVALDMPCILMEYILDNIRHSLKHITQLTLRLHAYYSHLDTNYTNALVYSPAYQRFGEGTKPWLDHELRTLTLSVPSWGSPCRIPGGIELDLSDFTRLHHLVFEGPFVKMEHLDDGPFILLRSSKTKVTIDPGLQGRKPTPWARPLASFPSFNAMPLSVPSDHEYREADHDAREERKLAFMEKVVKRAIEIDGGPSDRNLFLVQDDFVPCMLDGHGLDGYMGRAGCYYRSDMLLKDQNVEYLAQHVLKKRHAFESKQGFLSFWNLALPTTGHPTA